ncbi:GNAT family N-acetyltransferase [Telmatospirillum sp. J64-1]|uniref:GNAT family N-acetyltransferase n=1 Tax=Telmatospirillum sp. J64-1 TaxID=2502183 RepID=UPI001C8F9C52|nr:GNAT family N-acetyltransferase [Telmatospirillum sp. J64-1]
MKEATIRGYQPGDIGAITGMLGTYYAKAWGFGLSFEAEVATELSAFLVAFRPQRDGFWVAARQEETIGCIALADAGENRGQLRWFMVDPSAQGAGLGRKLLGESLSFARQVGYESLFLWTIDGLLAARHLYDAAGFRQVETQHDSRWGVPAPVQRLVLDLHRHDAV